MNNRRSAGGRLPAAVPVAAVAAAVLLSACTAAPAPGSSATASSPAAPTTASASAPSASFATSPSPTPTANPSASATVGAMIEGFPKTLIPLFSGAKVQASSVDRTTNPATASLVATTTASQADIIAFYTKALTDQGFKALEGDAVGSTASKDFVRNDGKETVNLAVVRVGGTSTFTIGANVAPESLK